MSDEEDKLIEKLRALTELASREDTPEHERVAAALALAKRMKESGALEAVEARRVAQPPAEVGIVRERVVVITTPLYVMNEYKDAWRLAKLDRQHRHLVHNGHVVRVPKEYVRKVEMMTGEELRVAWHDGARIIKRLTVLEEWVGHAREAGWYRWV